MFALFVSQRSTTHLVHASSSFWNTLLNPTRGMVQNQNDGFRRGDHAHVNPTVARYEFSYLSTQEGSVHMKIVMPLSFLRNTSCIENLCIWPGWQERSSVT